MNAPLPRVPKIRMYPIAPIFLIFPILCLFFSIFKEHRLAKTVISYAAFVFLYVLTKNGSDFADYGIIYSQVQNGTPFADIHGEFGFYLAMKVSTGLGFGYLVFRVILLTATAGLLFLSIYRISSEPLVSIFFLLSMFVIYTISTYRQFIVMVWSIVFIIRYFETRKMIFVLLVLPLALFHVSAVLVFGFLTFYLFLGPQRIEALLVSLISKPLLWALFACLSRIFIWFLLQASSMQTLAAKLIGSYASHVDGLVSFGMISRLFFYFAVCLFMRGRERISHFDGYLLFAFLLGQLIYVLIPFSTFMGRLFNNTNIYIVFLLPFVSSDPASFSESDFGFSPGLRNVLKYACYLVGIIVLVNQLRNQDGYYPYQSLLF